MRVHRSPEANNQPELVQGRITETDSPRAAEEKPLRELIAAWCSAYSHLNPKQMADLETARVEVVDGLGDEHYFMSRKDRERFWDDGFQMIEAQEFHPQCVFQHIRLLHPAVAIVQATVSHPHGIKLKSGKRIPPGNVEVDARSRKIEEVRVWALHQEIHDPIYRIDSSTYSCSDGVRSVEP